MNIIKNLEYNMIKSEGHEKAVNLSNKINSWTLGIGGGIAQGIKGLLDEGPVADAINGINYGKNFLELWMNAWVCPLRIN